MEYTIRWEEVCYQKVKCWFESRDIIKSSSWKWWNINGEGVVFLQGASLRKQVTDEPRPPTSNPYLSPISFLQNTAPSSLTPSLHHPSLTPYFHLYTNTSPASTSASDLKKKIRAWNALQWLLRVKSKHVTWHFLAISCRPLLTPKVFKLHGSSLRSLNTWSSFLSRDFYTAQDQRTLSPLFRSSIAYIPPPPTTRYVTLLFCSQRNSSALPITDLHLWFRPPEKRVVSFWACWVWEAPGTTM